MEFAAISFGSHNMRCIKIGIPMMHRLMVDSLLNIRSTFIYVTDSLIAKGDNKTPELP